jgi:hypothetical protein
MASGTAYKAHIPTFCLLINALRQPEANVKKELRHIEVHSMKSSIGLERSLKAAA